MPRAHHLTNWQLVQRTLRPEAARCTFIGYRRQGDATFAVFRDADTGYPFTLNKAMCVRKR